LIVIIGGIRYFDSLTSSSRKEVDNIYILGKGKENAIKSSKVKKM